jgi:sulfoxide reductase catalytic subunit YedY
MAYIKIPKGWEIPENQVTPESVYINRRKFFKDLGIAGAGALSLFGSSACAQDSRVAKQLEPYQTQTLDAKKNEEFTVTQKQTDEIIAATYNNFYEFTSSKTTVWKRVERFKTRPWEIEISGLVEKPMTLDIDDLIKQMPLEERIYRFRCVETWAMVVPWIGFPMKALLEKVQPKSDAKYVRMTTFMDHDVAPHQNDARLPWPYVEGLTLAEAMNDLTLLVVGIYGHTLPPQHGAPIRLIVPWKYGFKSIKSIVSIELTDKKTPNLLEHSTSERIWF